MASGRRGAKLNSSLIFTVYDLYKLNLLLYGCRCSLSRDKYAAKLTNKQATITFILCNKLGIPKKSFRTPIVSFKVGVQHIYFVRIEF